MLYYEHDFSKGRKSRTDSERLKDTFFEAIPSAEESEGAGTDIPGTVFAAALFTAYENKDLSAFMMAVCNSSRNRCHCKYSSTGDG